MKKIASLFFVLCFSIVLTSCSGISEIGDYKACYAPYPESCETYETYSVIAQNGFLSTELTDSQAFSLKVDTAAYTNVARYIRQSILPPTDAVRTEELINYFNYDAPMPEREDHPFSVTALTAASPLSEDKYMAYIRVKTPEIDHKDLPASNLTFLIDSSGSMLSYDKLPLLQQAFSLLVENLTEQDTVSIVTYAGSSAVLLDSVQGNEKERILSAINCLEAGGSTAGAEAIETAYKLAAKNYSEDKNNRVILASDGDFNIGISSVSALNEFISEKRDQGIYLSVLGFGSGNLRDDIMETLAANGDGNYSYIDTLTTAQKVLVDEMGANLFTVANDVKAQIQFNKEYVKEFRLLGYENRLMSSDDFDNAEKDAGEIGAGTDIVVLAEFILEEGYQEGSLFDVCIRYKTTDKNEQKEFLVSSEGISNEADSDFRFACAVAGFCELLRESEYIDDMTAEDVLQMAQENTGEDKKGYRTQFTELVREYINITELKGM